VYLPSRSEEAVIKMDGHVVKVSYLEGYYQIRNVNPGKHYFERIDRFSRQFTAQKKALRNAEGSVGSF
jgi:hypothetical protein